MPKSDYKILLVDDDKSYSQTLVERAFDDHCIELIHYIDWESAFTQLKGNPDKFQAIILDAKGKLTQDDSSENMSHILKALQDINRLEGHGIFIPYIINTGYIDDSVVSVLTGVKIYAKGDEEKMLKYLIEKIKCSPYDRLRKKHENILSLFDDVSLPIQSGRKLMDVMIFAEHPIWNKAADDFFTPLRKILEAVFWKLKEQNDIDAKCFPGNKINMKACIDYIEGNSVRIDRITFPGNRIIPLHVGNSLWYIYNMTGTFSHNYIGETEVSHYSLQSVVQALCEVLYWFSCFLTLQKNKLKTK